MSGWPDRPVVYELNTAAWLHDVGKRAATKTTLATVPAAEWDRVTPAGVDAVWLMGVWQRSRLGVELALEDTEQMESFRATLPDFGDSDVIGSAYSIRRYKVAGRFGGKRGLAAARAALAERGVRLIVDFVPNHVGPDHPWLTKHPEYFVQGSRRRSDKRSGSVSADRRGGHRSRPGSLLSRRGRTWCSSTRSPRRCARPPPRR